MPERRRKPALGREKEPALASRPTARAAGVEQFVQLFGNRAAAAVLQARTAAPHVARDRRPAGPLVQRATWADLGLDRQVSAARARIAFNSQADVLFGLPEDQKIQLRSRIEIALYRLELGLAHDWLGESHDLGAKIGSLLRTEPDKVDKKLTKAQIVAKKISEDLSELEHAADVVLRHGPADMAISKVHIGTKGPAKEGGVLPLVEKAGIAGFEKEGVLPPIDEPQLQADTYYRSRDGFIHAVEVKDSVNALRTKLADGEQYRRQVRWLTRHQNTPDYKPVVEYFIQNPTPFHRLLDPTVLDPFMKVEAAQLVQGQDWIKLGDEKFTYPGFKTLYDQAMNAFTTFTKTHKWWDDKKHTGKFLDEFFGTKAAARMSIGSPQTMEAFKRD
jgi:hypothetical protein